MNREYLFDILDDLLRIPSPSKKEKDIADYIIGFLKDRGLKIYLDENYDEYGGEAPTIFAYMKGNIEGDGYTLSAHTDTVDNNEGIEIIKEEGLWHTGGRGILGGDDKAGVAAILYLIDALKDRDHRDLYAVFTPAEEIGMRGARAVEWDKVREEMSPAKEMIVLDNSGPANEIAYQAPTSYSFTAEIYGISAHAGIEPEKGKNAIQCAAKIIARMPMGRINKFTTANVSSIDADFPSNIVPDRCTLKGEIRAQDDLIARKLLDEYKDIMSRSSCGKYKLEYIMEYPPLRSRDDLRLLNTVIDAYRRVGVDGKGVIIGGGSDGNYFDKEGFNTVIVGVGMEDVHTKKEKLHTGELIKTVRALEVLLTKKNGAS